MSEKRRRLDHIVSVRFTPEQMDQLRAQVGDDGSISAHIRDTVLNDVAELDETAVHSLPPTRSDERMHDLKGDCWCGPFILALGGYTTVRHNSAVQTAS
jgi:hypothetical protein